MCILAIIWKLLWITNINWSTNNPVLSLTFRLYFLTHWSLLRTQTAFISCSLMKCHKLSMTDYVLKCYNQTRKYWEISESKVCKQHATLIWHHYKHQLHIPLWKVTIILGIITINFWYHMYIRYYNIKWVYVTSNISPFFKEQEKLITTLFYEGT